MAAVARAAAARHKSGGVATGGAIMIKNYSDHAANERTFLAWLRTGLSIAAFGFVIERFNLFLAEFAQVAPIRPSIEPPLAHLVRPFGRYDGFALSVIGVVIIVLGGVRFVRTAREIDSPALSQPAGIRTEILLSGALALLAAFFCVYLALQ